MRKTLSLTIESDEHNPQGYCVRLHMTIAKLVSVMQKIEASKLYRLVDGEHEQWANYIPNKPGLPFIGVDCSANHLGVFIIGDHQPDDRDELFDPDMKFGGELSLQDTLNVASIVKMFAITQVGECA